MNRSFPWRAWLVTSGAAALLVVALARDEGMLADLSPAGWAALLLGTAPLVGAQLALGAPRVFARFQAWAAAQGPGALTRLTLAFTLTYLLANLLVGAFDPYAAVIFAVGVAAALGAWRDARGHTTLTWTDAAVWLLLWIPFDLRWNYDLWPGLAGLKYAWWAIAITVVAVVGWYGLRAWPEFGYRLVPRGRDVTVALAMTVAFAAIVIPVGLAIDFLQFPPSQRPTPLAVVATTVGLFLTVALPEELFFRGILLHGLDRTLRSRGWALALSSLAFGLMHWNNAGDLGTKIAYVVLATLAGVFYGLAYRRSGNNLLAAALTHTLVDLIWRFGFQ